MKLNRTKQGGALIEVLTASFIGTSVLFVAISVFFAGMASWMRGHAKITAETQAQNATRVVAQELREAMAVSVDTNGLGLSYRLPKKDENGNYVVPAVWDNVARRIELNASNKLVVSAPNSERVICEGVLLTDPLSSGGTADYRIFTAGAGTITRSLTVMIVTKTAEYRKESSTSRARERIYLRNIPDLSRG